MSARLGVSRTTIRKVLAALDAEGALTGSGRQRFVQSAGGAIQRFPEAETVPMAVQVEKRFMEWMLRDNALPGTAINELDLARRFGVATTGIREFLNRFQRFGLIEKRPNAGWMLKGFTPGFALELFEIREMFELRSARAFAALPESSPLWEQIEALRREHLTLLGEIDDRYHDFSDLDSRFHRLDQLGRPQPVHRRFLRSHHAHLSLSLSVEQAGRTATQRSRDPRTPDLYRGAPQPKCIHRRARLPGAFGLSQTNIDTGDIGAAAEA